MCNLRGEEVKGQATGEDTIRRNTYKKQENREPNSVDQNTRIWTGK